MKANLLMNSENQETLLEDIGSQVSLFHHTKKDEMRASTH